MFSKLYSRIKKWERGLKNSFGTDISTPEGRRAARRHNNLVDHAFLRRILPNRYQISAQAWRSNQPDPVHFPALEKIGIKSILNLRGLDRFSYYLFEREACNDYNMTLHDLKLSATELSSTSVYLDLLDQMQTLEKPMLIHCKSGADRTGIAAALYLLDQENATLDEARAQLSIKYAHQHWSKAGILDHFLNAYASDFAKAPLSIRDWIEHHYDREAVTASFLDMRRKK